ncbi:MAG: transketolase C-terminal domain-containing protein, partial [Acidobacteriota bacterium]|nr:transketolase C-terminal domain-containing protein [Acidobacteriota bacterium]
DVATVVAAGVTVFEALKAHEELLGAGVHLRVIDAYCVQPIDAETMVQAGTATGSRLITVEDHYAAGGLGDAVSDAVAPHGITVTRLAVRAVPRSGKAVQLLDRFGISSKQIVAAVHAQLAPDA